MITDKIDNIKRAKIRQTPVNSNRASQIGHPCERYLVYERTRWNEKILHGVDLQYIFDMGSAIERVVLTELDEAGILVIQQQRDFSDPRYQITGSIDGLIKIDNEIYPLEIKSCSPFIFDSLHTGEDLAKSKYPHIRAYRAQLTIYMFLSNLTKGVILFKNKVSGRLKEIWLELDYDYTEVLLKKVESVNRHCADGTLPLRIEYDERICGECGYRHICVPPVNRAGMEFKNDIELENLLNRYFELKPIVDEYNEIDEQLKERLKGVVKTICGDYLIDGSWRKSVRYDIPEEVKSQYKIETQYWIKKITRVE